MQYREFEVHLPGKTTTLGVLGETHLYSKSESTCAEKLVPQFDAIAMEGTDRPTRVDLAFLPLVPAMFAIARATKRTFPSARHIAKKAGKKIQYLETDMGKSFSKRQLLGIFALGLISIPFTPFIYAYLKSGRGNLDAILDESRHNGHDEHDGKQSWTNRLSKFAFDSNMAVRNKKMAERTRDLVMSGVGNVLHVSGSFHTPDVVDNLLKLQGDDFRLEEVSPATNIACSFIPRIEEAPTTHIQPDLLPLAA